ncbi:hypothetical protein [uncultured Fibrobacter sp.]|uniref:hypothetical protein n=1 Tax=uncultured Fibrobacter sp. TaxID=261512 RepID=UPI0028043039|nr:hypothetical protein [uncultured Fibrobacter sp.]
MIRNKSHWCLRLAALLVPCIFLACSASPAPKPAGEIPKISLLQELENYSCPEKGFSGTGVSTEYNGALEMAVSQIAVQIESSVQVDNTLKKSQSSFDGEEHLNTNYQIRTTVSASLKNREDVKVVQKAWRGDSLGVVACLSFEDARKPYWKEFRQSRDEFDKARKLFGQSEHPQERIGLFKKLSDSFIRLEHASSILSNLSLPQDIREIESAYREQKRIMEDFRKRWRFYYGREPESPVESALLQGLRQEFPLTVADSCESGLIMRMDFGEPESEEGIFGYVCRLNVALYGTGCGKEEYFAFHDVLKGSGKYSGEEACSRLEEAAKKAGFLKNWIAEIKKWELP